MSNWLAAMAIVMVACGGAKPAETDPVRPASSAVSDCTTDVAALRAWMDELIVQGAELTLGRYGIDMVRLSAGTDAEALERSPAVTIGPDIIAFNGELVADVATAAQLPEGVVIDELHERLLAERKAQCITAPELRVGLTLQIDRLAPWRAIRAVTDTAYASRYDRVVFAFEGPVVVQAPPPAPDLAAAIADWEAQVFDAEDDAPPPTAPHPVEVAWGECDPLVEATELLGIDDRAVLLRALPDALDACECAVPANNVKAIVWWWSGRQDGHRAVGIENALAETGADRRVVAHDDGAVWADSYALIGGAGPIALSSPNVVLNAGTLTSRPVDICD